MIIGVQGANLGYMILKIMGGGGMAPQPLLLLNCCYIVCTYTHFTISRFVKSKFYQLNSKEMTLKRKPLKLEEG